MQGSRDYEVGKGKPPKHSQFQRGESGNPKGKTAAQKKAEYKAGELAAMIQKRMLEALHNSIAASDSAALLAIAADPLRLIKDAMDREFGTAVQKSDHTSSDGSMAPKPTVIEFIAPKAADESDD